MELFLILKNEYSMLKLFQPFGIHTILVIYSEKESNHTGLENRIGTPNISLLDKYQLVQILQDSQ